MASVSSGPRTVEEIFKDYSARRAGIIRALTHGTLCCYNLCISQRINVDLFLFIFLCSFRINIELIVIFIFLPFQMWTSFMDSVIQVKRFLFLFRFSLIYFISLS